MNFRLIKSVILSSSLLLALTGLSSCGKDKEVKSNPPTAQSVPAPTEEKSPEGELTPANPENSLPQSNQATQTPDTSLPQATQPNAQDHETLPSLPALPTIPGVGANNQTGGDGRGGRVGERKEALRAYQVDFSKAVALKTGGQQGELSYTSVGDDGVMEEFKLYNGKVAAQQQMLNNNLAKAIVNAKLARATSDGEISLTLTVDEFGTLNTYRLVAKSDSEKMNLSLAKPGVPGQLEFQGGFVKCLDLDGGCDVAYAKLKFAGGYTRVIFRNVVADMHFLIQQNVVGNSAFSTMQRYIDNAVNGTNVAQKIDAMKLSSFEVINGRSGVGAMITTLDRQVVGFNVPMLVSSMNSDVNVAVAKNADLSKNYDLVNLTKSHSVEMSRSINQVRLVKNDGRGHFKLQLFFGTEASPASIWVVAAGMQKEIMSIPEIRNFESKLKAF